MKKLCIFLTLIVCAVLTPLSAQGADTARQTLDKAVAKVKKAGGISLSFAISSSQGSANGTMKVQGNKFQVSTPASKVWYDGKTMWTYSPQSNETTLTTPTAAELGEINPMLYLNAGNRFDVKYGKNSGNSKTLILTPKSRREGVKTVTLILNATTLFPQKILITPSSGGVATLSVSSLKTSQKFTASTFVYPKASYPKVKIIDLR